MKKLASRPLNSIQADKTWSPVLQNIVLDWFSKNGRDFPWRNTSNAFFIYIAEVLLRQTQARRVVETYLELVTDFPDAQSMAHANIVQLRERFRLLGLVKRADHLAEASSILVRNFGGRVPDRLKELMDLPGVGEYSARAVLCLAYNVQVPMIDEGSGRVLRRIFNIHSKRPAYSDRKLLAIAEELLPKGFARSFNLGLIDIAAAYCHVKRACCPSCPLSQSCMFLLDGKKVERVI